MWKKRLSASCLVESSSSTRSARRSLSGAKARTRLPVPPPLASTFNGSRSWLRRATACAPSRASTSSCCVRQEPHMMLGFASPSILALTCCANGITLHSLNHDVISSEFLGIDASDKLMVKATLGYFQDVDLFTGKQRGQRPFDATLLQAEFSVREALASVARSPPYCSRGARPAGRFTESRQVNTHVASVIGHRGSTTSPAGAAIQREGEVDRALEAAARWSGSRLEGATVARSVASR